jgi:hypothetical protein
VANNALFCSGFITGKPALFMDKAGFFTKIALMIKRINSLF